MPIVGLTDRTPSFKEIGRLRLGIPKEQALKEGPKEISYFRADFRPDAQDALVDFKNIYGSEPKSVRIRLPFTELNRCWDAWYEVYNKAGMLGRADGERWIYLRHNQTGELLVKDGDPLLPDGLPVDADGRVFMPFERNKPVYSYKNRKGEDVGVFAKPSGRLQVLIPDLKRAAFVTVITHSVYNVMRISEQLAGIQQAAKSAGMNITMVPMILSRRKESISVSINGKKALQEHYLLNIEIDPLWMEAQFAYLDRLLPGMKQLALPSGFEALPEEVAEVDDFYEPEGGSDTNTALKEPSAPAENQPEKPQEKHAKHPIDEKLRQVAAMKTPKGMEIGNLSDEQLNVLRTHDFGEFTQAAKFMAEQAGELAWAEYVDIRDRLTTISSAAIEPLPTNTTTNIMVLRWLKAYRPMLDELEIEIPQEFR